MSFSPIRRASSRAYLRRSRQALALRSDFKQKHVSLGVLHWLTSQVTFKGAAVLVTLASLALYLIMDSRRSVLVLDPISVPRQFSDAGLTAEIMAQRMRERIVEIQQTDEAASPKDQIRGSVDQTLPDIEIPEAHVSVHTVEDALRKIFHTEARHISVDFAYFEAKGLASLRCRILKGDEIVRSGPPYRLQLDSVENISERADKVAELLAQQATEVTDPYLEGMYLLLAKGQKDEADLLAARMLGNWPDVEHEHAKAYLLKGYVADERELDKIAIGDAQAAIDMDTSFPYAHYVKANICQDAGLLDEATAEYVRTIALDPRSATSANSHSNLGSILSEQHKLDEAAAEYRRAIELDPKSALPHDGLGTVLRGQHKLDEAAAEYRRAGELDPKSADPHDGLGNTLRDQHQLDEAAAEYRRAGELNPKSVYPHIGLGNVLRDQHKLDEAAAEYRRAIELDSKYAAPHTGLGNALTDEHKLDEAIAEHRRAVELDPNSAYSHTGLGNVLRDQCKLDEAAAAYRRAIELDPNSADSHTGLGNVFRDEHKLDEAAAEYRRAIELDSNSADPHDGLGSVLREKHVLNEAAAEYRRAIELDPKCALPHHNLAILFAQERQPKLAYAEQKHAHQLDPHRY
jgi:tetratricopeptide (TPR) repeat protein